VNSDYCYDIEVKRALELHASGKARVIPVILRPVDWQDALFGKLQALPKDGKPVTTWHSQDEAFLDIVNGIKAAISNLATAHIEASPRGNSTSSQTIDYSKFAELLSSGDWVEADEENWRIMLLAIDRTKYANDDIYIYMIYHAMCCMNLTSFGLRVAEGVLVSAFRTAFGRPLLLTVRRMSGNDMHVLVFAFNG